MAKVFVFFAACALLACSVAAQKTCKKGTYTGELVATNCAASIKTVLTKCQSKQIIILNADCSITGKPAAAPGCPAVQVKQPANAPKTVLVNDKSGMRIMAEKYIVGIFNKESLLQPIVNAQGQVMCQVAYKVPKWKPF